MLDSEPNIAGPQSAHEGAADGTVDPQNSDLTIVTIVGAGGFKPPQSSPESCVRLSITGVEDVLCTSLVEGESPVWNESFVVFAAGEIELSFELHCSLPGDGSLIAQLKAKLDVGAHGGQDSTWQLIRVDGNSPIGLTFSAEVQEMIFDEPLTYGAKGDEQPSFPGALSLKDITLRSTMETNCLPLDTRLFVELVVDGEAFDRTLAAMQDTQDGTWKCDGVLSLPAGIPFTLNVYAEEAGQTDGKLLASLAVTGEYSFPDAKEDQRQTHSLASTNNSPNLEIAFTTEEFSLDTAEPMSRHRTLSNSPPASRRGSSRAFSISKTGSGRSASLKTQRSSAPSDVVQTPLRATSSKQQIPFVHPTGTHGSTLQDYIQAAKEAFEDPESGRIDAFHEMATTFPDDNPFKLIMLEQLGKAFFRRFMTMHNSNDLDKSIACCEESVKLTPDGDPAQGGRLARWGLGLAERIEGVHDDADTDNAIFALQNSIALTPEDDVNLPGRLNSLGNAFLARFESLKQVDDINESITSKEKAVLLSFDHPSHAGFLNDLGRSLSLRFMSLRDSEDLERAVYCQQSAVDLVPDWDTDTKGLCYNNLGHTLRVSFQEWGKLEHIDQSISALKTALPLINRNPRLKAKCLDNLALSFKLRFDNLANPADLDLAISMQEAAVAAAIDPGTKSQWSNTLSDLYQDKYNASRNTHHLDKAVEAKQTSVKLLPLNDRDLPTHLTNLGNVHWARFSNTGSITDLQEAVQHQEEALSHISDDDPEKGLHLMNLGLSYWSRFERLGDIDDVERSIRVQEEAARLTKGDDDVKALIQSNLGNALRLSYSRTGQIADLDRAIQCHEQAISLMPDSNKEKARPLNNLGAALMERFYVRRDAASIDGAILTLQQAVDRAEDGDVMKYGILTNLGGALLEKYSLTDDHKILDRAVETAEASDRQIPENHPEKLRSVQSLGTIYRRRFRALGNVEDADKAIAVGRRAVELLPDGHPNEAGARHELALSLFSRFRVLGTSLDAQEAIFQFSQAAKSPIGQPYARFVSASDWAKLAGLFGPHQAFEAYGQAIGLLPSVAWLGLSVADRHRLIIDAGTIVNEATACAIKCARYDTAVEWLEQGRSIVWGQLLQLRSPIDELEAREPGLATQLKDISTKLEAANARQESMTSSSLPREGSRDQRQLALDWDRLLEKVRSLPGLEAFMRPRKISQLASAARAGPVVILTAHTGSCNALILIDGLDSIVHVPLPEFSRERAQELQIMLDHLRSNTAIPRSRSDRGFAFPRQDEEVEPQDKFKIILFQLWDAIVRPVVNELALHCVSEVEDLPHIWWCPTGSLAFLPIHAAGNYETDEPGHKLSDYAVSSYTPTLTALLEKPPMKANVDFRLLAVGQAATPGQDELPNTERELGNIQERAGLLQVDKLDGNKATVAGVLRGMKESNWVHLACHGTQNTDDPTKSALLLADGELQLSTLVNQSFPHAEFAFLSACQTATGDVNLEEEAVHLAAGMLLAGYPSVIATSWSILDKDGPIVADAVYQELFKDGKPDRSRAAWALHRAVQELRLSGAHFSSWIPFIHLGE